MSVEQLSFKQLSLNPTHPPSITLTKDPTRSRKARNRQYVPSDDEDDEDLTDEDDDHDDTPGNQLGMVNRQPHSGRPSSSTSTVSSGKQQQKKVTPLPSDDEDEDDDEDDVIDSEDDDNVQLHLSTNKKRLYRLQGVQSTSQLGNYIPKSTQSLGQVQRHSADEPNGTTSSPSVINLSSYDSDDDCILAPQQKLGSGSSIYGGGSGNDTFLTQGSQLQQWQYMQQYHQAQMTQFNHCQQRYRQYHHQHQQQPHPIKSYSSSSHLRRQYQQQQQQHGLSGMELMTQLEQDKADAKRQKPKLNPTHAKIQGLLAKLPEPGAHNISFQQVYQQQQQAQYQHRQHHHQQQQHGFNRTTASVGRSPSPTPSHRSCTPTMKMMQQQQQQHLMAGPYNMYGYPAPSYYQHQQQQTSPRSGSVMSMNRP